MRTQAIVEIDLHGKNTYQAKIAIDSALRRSGGVYRIRLIHGCNMGTAIRDMIKDDYSHHPSVLRMEFSSNGGQTDLILREL